MFQAFLLSYPLSLIHSPTLAIVTITIPIFTMSELQLLFEG